MEMNATNKTAWEKMFLHKDLVYNKEWAEKSPIFD